MQVRTSDSYPVPTDYANPLRAYTLPEDLGVLKQTSDCFNPTAKPNYIVPYNNEDPYTPKGYWTIRHPDANYQAQVRVLNLFQDLRWSDSNHPRPLQDIITVRHIQAPAAKESQLNPCWSRAKERGRELEKVLDLASPVYQR